MVNNLIERQAAIDALNKLDISDGVGISSLACGVQESAISVIQHLPSAQQEPQKATWALHTYMPHHYYCTHCKNDSPYNKTWSYCPNCGYEMEGYV